MTRVISRVGNLSDNQREFLLATNGGVKALCRAFKREYGVRIHGTVIARLKAGAHPRNGRGAPDPRIVAPPARQRRNCPGCAH